MRAIIIERDNIVVDGAARANLDKLANLIRICGFLMQTKAYLFLEKWQSQVLRPALVEMA
jgi:hypothetical protein